MLADINANYDTKLFENNESFSKLYRYDPNLSVGENTVSIFFSKGRERILCEQAGVRYNPVASKIIFLRSPTGSGKTLYVGPQVFLRIQSNFRMRTKPYGSVICAFPQVSSAQAAAQTIGSFYPTMQPGKEVAISTGRRKVRATDSPSFTMCTTQTLTNQIVSMAPEAFCNRYSFVFIDECHETTGENKHLLFEIKRLLGTHAHFPNCPIFVFMSATFDIYQFGAYFGIELNPLNCINLQPKKLQLITERFVEPEDHFAGLDVYHVCAKWLETIIQQENAAGTSNRWGNDVLIFVAGEKDAEDIEKAISELNFPENSYLGPYIVTSRALASDINVWKTAMRRKPSDLLTRRLFISTEVVEKSITIESLAHVIDMGWHKIMMLFPLSAEAALVKIPAGGFSLTQRRGRVGRVGQGCYWGAYTGQYRRALPDTLVERSLVDTSFSQKMLSFLVSRLQFHVLRQWNQSPYYELLTMMRAKTYMKEHDFVEEFDYIGGTSIDLISAGYNELYHLGLITMQGNVTPVGVMISNTKSHGIYDSIFIMLLEVARFNKFDIALCSLLFADLTDPVQRKAASKRFMKSEFKKLRGAFGELGSSIHEKDLFMSTAVPLLRPYPRRLAPLIVFHEYLNHGIDLADLGIDQLIFDKKIDDACGLMDNGGKNTNSIFDYPRGSKEFTDMLGAIDRAIETVLTLSASPPEPVRDQTQQPPYERGQNHSKPRH
jgi:HrpA-like RNA helicase